MTAFILYILLWLWDNRNLDSITKANERKLGAEKSYKDKKYLDAAQLYKQITYGSIFSDPASRLNMAHAYYQAGMYSFALTQYELLKNISDRAIASVANAQIAMIRVAQKDSAAALASFKTSLRLEPGNDLARVNYIILKKHFSGVEKAGVAKNTRVPDKETEAKQAPMPSKEKQPENLEVEENQKRQQLLKSLKEMNMSEDQARAILDAMKSNESQYIYQLRRKQYARKPEQNDQIEW
jgi:hypothetical protein